jgi:hypothetical protein
LRANRLWTERAPPGHQQRARYAMTSGCRRYRARRLKALGHNPQLLAIRPAPPAPSLYHLKPFKLSIALMAVHKDCYATLGLIRQGGPRRRETKNVSLRLIKRSQRGHTRRTSARGRKARQRSLASRPGYRAVAVSSTASTRAIQGGVTASEIYMRQSEPPCSRKSAVPGGIFGSLAWSNGAQPIDRAEV